MAKKPKAPKPCTIDFETVAIDDAPFYPPPPIGVSIKYPGKKSKHYAWGHIEGNNSTFAEAKHALDEAYKHPDGVLMHNSKFDMEVAEIHMGMPALPWPRIHESMFLLFLDDPNQKNMGLKPAAKRLLEMPEDERDAVADWIVRRQPVPGVRITSGPKSKNTFMKFLAWAPGGLVGQYADGDVERTELIFNKIHATVLERDMGAAYDRERQLMIVLREMERQGVRVDVDRLRVDVTMYGTKLLDLEAWLRKKIQAPLLNFDSAAELVAALESAKMVDVALLGVTKKGNVSTNKVALDAAVTDRTVCQALRYRGALKTCLGTFMRPWLATAEASGGLIFTTWNQTRSPDGGTRTGRLSSTPNFQNMPKEFEPLFAEEADAGTIKKLRLPKMPMKLPALPLCRSYIIPFKPGHVLLGRDYSQQEPRILAHFEDGDLKQQYIDNPWIDYHDNAKFHLDKLMGTDVPRKKVKGINLGLIYGMGEGKMAEQTGSTVEEVKQIKATIYGLYAGLKDMNKDMRARAKLGLPLRTWGGREYYCEPPIILDGKTITFEYKMVNSLIQSSAADCTKEAMIRFFGKKRASWHLTLQVHDEVVISAPRSEAAEAMETLRACMESVEFDVQILSEGAMSDKNWSEMLDTDKKGKVLVAL